MDVFALCVPGRTGSTNGEGPSESAFDGDGTAGALTGDVPGPDTPMVLSLKPLGAAFLFHLSGFGPVSEGFSTLGLATPPLALALTSSSPRPSVH
jgi:hypothetical protein